MNEKIKAIEKYFRILHPEADTLEPGEEFLLTHDISIIDINDCLLNSYFWIRNLQLT